MLKDIGPPVETFGRFGMAYREDQASKPLVDRFSSAVPVGTRRTILVRDVRITSATRRLADKDYVLCLLQDRDKVAFTQSGFRW